MCTKVAYRPNPEKPTDLAVFISASWVWEKAPLLVLMSNALPLMCSEFFAAPLVLLLFSGERYAQLTVRGEPSAFARRMSMTFSSARAIVHPHGGGEGKTGIGRPGPSTPWGKPALGLKTRKSKKASNKLIVRRRDGRAIK
jgi:hypothetical protein